MWKNKRKEESDISPVVSKHMSLRVKSKPISDVHLHVPHTIVTSSVVNRDELTPHHENVTSRWKGMSVKDEEAADGVKDKETSLEEKDDLKRMVDAEEDDEPPELIIRDDDSTISEEEPPYIYEHIGFNTEPCQLESWVEGMIEACEEQIKKERSRKKQKKKKKKKPKKRIIIEDRELIHKEESKPPFYFANVGLEMAASSMVKWQIGPNTFLADSGASSHMGHCDAGMFDLQDKTCGIKVGDGKTLAVTKIGKKSGILVQADGTKTNVVLENYKHVEGLWVNLFSVTQALASG